MICCRGKFTGKVHWSVLPQQSVLPSLAQVLNWSYQLSCPNASPNLNSNVMCESDGQGQDVLPLFGHGVLTGDHDFHNFHFLGLVTVKFMQFPYTCCHGSASGWHQRTQVENDLSSCGQDLHLSRPWEKLCNLISFSRFPCSWIKLFFYKNEAIGIN